MALFLFISLVKLFIPIRIGECSPKIINVCHQLWLKRWTRCCRVAHIWVRHLIHYQFNFLKFLCFDTNKYQRQNASEFTPFSFLFINVEEKLKISKCIVFYYNYYHQMCVYMHLLEIILLLLLLFIVVIFSVYK